MTDDRTVEEGLIAARRLKHEAMLGAAAYPHRFERTHTSGEIHEGWAHLEAGTETEDEVVVAGRLMNTREMGKLAFGVLQDAGGRIQLFVDRTTMGDDFDRFLELDGGDWIGVTGTVMATKKGELSVRVRSFTLLAKAIRPLPDKWHGLKDVEARSRRRYVDLMANDESLQVALKRVAVVSALRREFESRGFVEVDTPVLLPQATGAAARPFVTEHNALDLELNLRIATELYLKRLVVGGIERVFEIGRIFRNEGVDSTHNPEFTMLEAYQALADYEDMMRLIEDVFAAVARSATGDTVIEYQGEAIDLAPPYRRARLLDLVAEAADEAVTYDMDLDELRAMAARHGVHTEATWGSGRIVVELYEAIAEGSIRRPTFVIDFPREVSPLARSRDDDPNITERFELVIAGSEYCNAFSELNDPIDQRRRFEAQAAARAGGDEEANPIDDDYIRALEYGLPPTGGLGIGVDRLVMLLTDQAHIREVILFPTMRPE